MPVGSCMVLCAGLGTRLRPLTDELPKPLVPVGDRSILAHALTSLARAGFARAVINTHHLPHAFDAAAGEWPLPVERVHEPSIRGTAGGIAGARAELGLGPVLVYNGDIWVRDAPIGALTSRVGDGLLLAVAPRPPGEGTVGIDTSGRVVRLRGEQFGTEHAGGDYVGIAALGPRCLSELPAAGCLIGDYALPELRAGRSIQALSTPLEWTDAGDLPSYLRANLAWLGKRAAWLGAGVEVAPGIELDRCILGDGVCVSGRGTLARVVAWPGARVRAPLADAVVTRANGAVPSGSLPHHGSGQAKPRQAGV